MQINIASVLEEPEAIINHHYVDDYLDGTETEEGAVKLIGDVIYVHSKAGFEIRNFISNSLVVLEQLPENSLTNQIQSEEDRRADKEKVLGPTFLYGRKESWPKIPQPLNGMMDSSDEVQVNLITEVLSQVLPEIKSHYTWVNHKHKRFED
ncbi:hypothetical protein JTB14_025035 [Gonioctena quinquepunctata]|nr:hypothetical protein JTB14_025035 [Gonioctena quinquepunctata]